MKCTVCSIELGSSDNFCPVCGAKVVAREESTQAAPSAPKEGAEERSGKSAKSYKKPAKKERDDKPAASGETPYFTPMQQWVFTGVMSAVVIGLTIFGFVGAK